MKDTIKVFEQKSEHGLSHKIFLKIGTDFKYYKVKPYIDRFGSLCQFREKMADSLFAVDAFNNTIGSWRINGWKKAQKELEAKGYTFLKDLPIQFIQLTQQKEHANLNRFLNDEPLQKLENIHSFSVGMVFGKGKRPLYKITEIYYDYVVLEHITFQVKLRNGVVKNFSEQFNARELERLVRKGSIVQFESEDVE